MQKLKWYLAIFLIGTIIGAGAMLYFVYRPASTVIADLRAESERAAEQYRTEIAEYSDLLSTARGRAQGLAEDLARAAKEHRAAVEQVGRLEDQARSLQELIGEIQASGGRASEYNRAIRDEAEGALGELRKYCAALAASLGYSGERDPPAED
ncbi:hypothetical protein ES705_44064 [subsurface metagenome]